MSQLERLEEERRYGSGQPGTGWLSTFVLEQQEVGAGLAGLLPKLVAALDTGAGGITGLSLGLSTRGGVLGVLKRVDPQGARQVAFVGGTDTEEVLTRIEQMFEHLEWRRDRYANK